MNKNEWMYRKVTRYSEIKIAVEDLKDNFKLLLGVNNSTEEEIEEKYQRHMAIEILKYLICQLIFDGDLYKVKEEVLERKFILQWLNQYGIDINTVTKKDIDTIFEIIKKI